MKYVIQRYDSPMGVAKALRVGKILGNYLTILME